MIRAIFRRRMRDSISGCQSSHLVTKDFECPTIEHHLSKGGYGETGFELFDLIGCEVLPQKTWRRTRDLDEKTIETEFLSGFRFNELPDSAIAELMSVLENYGYPLECKVSGVDPDDP